MPPPLCCTHPTDPARPLSPTDPPRPINHIFALAALPDDHPHANALRLPARRAPKLSKSIVRSPSFAGKIRGQLRRRKTVGDFGAGVDGFGLFDGDAKVLGSGEVLAAVGLEATSLNSGLELSRLGVPPLAGPARRVRSSLALGAGRERSERETSEVSDIELQDLALLNLGLAASQVDGAAEQLYGTVASDAEPATDDQQNEVASVETLKVAEAVSVQDVDAIEGTATANGSAVLAHDFREDLDSVHSSCNNRSESHVSFHLSKKHISQQLRSTSQLSGAPTGETDRLTPEAWTFHRRERSNCGYGTSTINGDSSRSRHMHQTSDSGINSTHVPTSWGRVVRDRDASSSIYSRPTSPEVHLPYDIPADLAAVVDWPLTDGVGVSTDPSAEDVAETATRCPADQIQTSITVAEPEHNPVTDIDTSTCNNGLETEACSVVSHIEPSHKSTSSSTDKRSRFLERFTPPKRLVKKRRSFFKFLRAGSRRLQHRSISTPVLLSATSQPFVDGSADENDLLTVQYELTGLEGNPVRSVSLNNLPSEATRANGIQDVASSPDLRRKPSLAEYERHLSVVGDNRRRPSARDLKRLSQIEEDDLHNPVTTKKKSFSLHSKTRETDPLMAAALERQLREKALLRSPSKRSVPVSEGSSMSFLMTPWNQPSSAQPQSPERDPLDTSFKKSSDIHLSPPLSPLDSYTPSPRPSNQQPKSSKKPVILHTPSSMSRDSTRSRIGSSLESWTRYPSHTRGERCTSAGAADNVLAHDFAIDSNHKRLGSTNESDQCDPDNRTLNKQSTKSSKISLPKSRSATFTSFVRYYSNLFSSPDFHGKGRRTSIAMGGKLARPELELLPPVLPTLPNSPSSTHSQSDAKIRHSPLAHISEQTEGIGESNKQPSLVHPNPLPTDDPAGSMIAFRGDSVFGSTTEDREPETPGEGPMNDGCQPNQTGRLAASAPTSTSTPPGQSARITDLDGASDPTSADVISHSSPASKAQAWSTAYQSCLIIPPTPPSQHPDSLAMPPPALKPHKKRSPQQLEKQTARLHADAAIRRFPSVTVVDDRKGHWRSVSFISVKSGKSGASDGGFVRESSNDLLALVEKREREEREKLLRAVG